MPAFQPPLHDPKAFGDLFTSTHLSIYRYIFGMLGGPVEDVEDIACETYLRAWNGRNQFYGTDHEALCWLITIARHLVIDAFRKKKSHFAAQEIDINGELIEELFPAGDCSPEEQVVHRELFRQLWQSVGKLPAEKRELLVLRYFFGWRVNEIADYVCKGDNTISVSIRRSLEEIRQNWSLKEDDDRAS